MSRDNKKNKDIATERDDDPTAELEILASTPGERSGTVQQAESDTNTFDFNGLESGVVEGDETISSLKSDLKLRAERIGKLQFDVEQLRSRWSGLEKELKVREEVMRSLTQDLKSANKKRSRAEKALKKRETEIASLQTTIGEYEQSLRESSELVNKSREREQLLQSQGAESRQQSDAAQEKLNRLMSEVELERSGKQEALKEVEAISRQIESLSNELAESRATVAELQQYVDRRKSDWDTQQEQLRQSKNKIEELSGSLQDTRTDRRDDNLALEGLNARLTSLESERDSLVKEITQLRKDAQNKDADGAAADRKLLAEQAGLLAGRNFEINELRRQIARTESYADELRRQLQDRLLLTENLQTRQRQLEASLSGANAQIAELSNNIDDLRSGNASLVEEKSRLKDDFDREIRQLRFELTEAQETITDQESLTQQLTSDLVDTREANMNLETRLGATEEETREEIAELKRGILQLESLNEELQDKVNTKDHAISALLAELTKRSEAIESIDEMEDVIHELDDRMSEQIDERSNVERERITRLLIGKIGGQKLRFPLFKNRLTIGRTGHNDIQLKAPFISRRHAVIVTDDDCTRIVDWGSKNGVYVNTRRVKEQVLHNGDIVTIGTADFTFEERPKR